MWKPLNAGCFYNNNLIWTCNCCFYNNDLNLNFKLKHLTFTWNSKFYPDYTLFLLNLLANPLTSYLLRYKISENYTKTNDFRLCPVFCFLMSWRLHGLLSFSSSVVLVWLDRNLLSSTSPPNLMQGICSCERMAGT